MDARTCQTWDRALVHRLSPTGLRRRRFGGGLLAALAVFSLVVGLMPGIARAQFERPGLNGAQLDLYPDGNHPDEFNNPAGGGVIVTGKSFTANALAEIFECEAGATESGADLHQECQPLNVAQTDAVGAFRTAVHYPGTQDASDSQTTFIQPVFQAPNGKTVKCRTYGPTQCTLAAATYPGTTSGAPTSEAEHYFCFHPHPPFGPIVYKGPPTTVDLTLFPSTDCQLRPAGSTTTTTIPPSPEWQEAQAMGRARDYLTAAVGTDGRIYALGGADADGSALASAEVFDPCGARSWSAIPRMSTARTQFAAATAPDGHIYAIGGNDALGGSPLASVEVYDPASKSWSDAPSLALPRSELVATTGTDGRIYAIGGRGGPLAALGSQSPVTTVEVFDPATNKWQLSTPLLVPTTPYGAVATPDGRIYVIGQDVDGLASVQSYTPGPAGAPGVWQVSTAEAYSLPLGPAVTGGPDGRIYVLGGANSGQSTPAVWTYDPRADKWTTATGALKTPRTYLTAGAGLDGRIYALGGSARPASNIQPAQPMASTEALQVGPNLCPNVRPPVDFDGNYTTDYAVFRPASGSWYAKDGLALGWGASGDIPVPADYDGDAKTDVAIFRPSTGLWAIRPSGGGPDVFVTYGVGSDVPVVADYDGDGKADIAIWRPDTSTWWIHRSSDSADVAFTYGVSTDVPVPADYDGDHKADIAMYRNGTWFVHRSSDGADTAMNYGAPGDIPVPANYDAPGTYGDGLHEGDYVADFAVFRPSSGAWYLHHSYDGTDEAFGFGVGGDIPVVGDYGSPNSPVPDRISDPAVYRSGQWFTELGTSTCWGVGTDIPLAIPYAIRRAYFS